LILSRIVKIVATKCQILRIKCTKIDFGAAGAYSAPPDSLAGFKGPTSKGRGIEEGRGRGRGRGRQGEGGENGGKVREGRKGGKGRDPRVYLYGMV